jgi:hypothetical protein
LALCSALQVAIDPDTRANLVLAIGVIAELEEGRSALLKSGVSSLLVGSLQTAFSDEFTCEVAEAISAVCASDEGLETCLASNMCTVLVQVLASAISDHVRCSIANIIFDVLFKNPPIRIVPGMCDCLVASLASAEEEDARISIAACIHSLAQKHSSVDAPLFDTEACKTLLSVWALSKSNDATCSIVHSITNICVTDASRGDCLIQYGICQLAVRDFTSLKGYETRIAVTELMSIIAGSDLGVSGLVAAGATPVLIGALKTADSDATMDAALKIDIIACILATVDAINSRKEGSLSLIQAGACGVLVDAMKSAMSDDMVGDVAGAMVNLTLFPEGLQSLMEVGAVDALVTSLKFVRKDEDDSVKRFLAQTIGNIAEHPEGGVMFIRADVCPALTAALQLAHDDEAKTEIAIALGVLAAVPEEGMRAVLACNGLSAIVVALGSAQTAESIDDILKVVANVATINDGRSALVDAGACTVVVQIHTAMQQKSLRNLLYHSTWSEDGISMARKAAANAIDALAVDSKGQDALLSAGWKPLKKPRKE